MTSTNTPTFTPVSSLEALRLIVQGGVFVSGDEGFESSHQAWNLTIVHRPSVVVVARTESDVQAAIAYANANDLKVAVQSTGHGQFRVCDGGLLVNTSQLRSVTIDGSVAQIGAGCQWGDVLAHTQEHGLAALSGSAPHVGVVGYMLGGGYGLMLRKHGLMVDSVRSIRIVTPDAEFRTASRNENPELFWALLGGGGAYGVVTSIEIDLFPNPRIFGGSIMFPAERAEEIYTFYADWTQELSEDVTSSISLMTFPLVPFVPEFLHGKSVVIVTACVTALQLEAEELLAPLRSLGGEIVDTFCEHNYVESGQIYQDPVQPLPAHGSGVLLKELTPSMVQELLSSIGPVPESPNLKIDIRHLGGAMAKVSASDNAIGRRREAKYLLYFLGVPMGPHTQPQMEAQAERVFEAMRQHVLCRGPLNWIGEANVACSSVQSVFDAETFERLLEVKRRYDPKNRFPYAGVGITLQD